MAAVKNTSVEGEQNTIQSRPGVVETVFKGRLTARLVEAAATDLERTGNLSIWIVDATAATGFDTESVRVGTIALSRLKKRGLRRMIGILPSATMRMAARAASLASGLDMRIVERRHEVGPFMRLED